MTYCLRMNIYISFYYLSVYFDKKKKKRNIVDRRVEEKFSLYLTRGFKLRINIE